MHLGWLTSMADTASKSSERNLAGWNTAFFWPKITYTPYGDFMSLFIINSLFQGNFYACTSLSLVSCFADQSL